MKFKARMDIRVEEYKFNLSYVTVGGAAANLKLSKANWLLSKDQEKHWFVEGELDDRWVQIYVGFIAGGTGEVSLEFRGGWFDDLETDRHEILLSEVEMEGTPIINGDFRETDEDGGLVGWQGVRTGNYGSIVSRTGKKNVVIWHDEPAVQKILVEPGKKYKISAWFRPNVI